MFHIIALSISFEDAHNGYRKHLISLTQGVVIAKFYARKITSYTVTSPAHLNFRSDNSSVKHQYKLIVNLPGEGQIETIGR